MGLFWWVRKAPPINICTIFGFFITTINELNPKEKIGLLNFHPNSDYPRYPIPKITCETMESQIPSILFKINFRA